MLCALVVDGFGQAAAKIEGEVFLTTQSAEVLKLALVHVALYEEEQLLAVVAERREAAAPYLEPMSKIYAARVATTKAMDKAWDDSIAAIGNGGPDRFGELKAAHDLAFDQEWEARGYLAFLTSARYLLSSLPAALELTKTDGDGKFAMHAKPGNYVLVAHATRRMGRDAELYDWAVRVRVGQGEEAVHVMLANDDTTRSGSPFSAVKSGPGELDAVGAEEHGGLAGVVKYIAGIDRRLLPKPAPDPAAAAMAEAQKAAVAKYPDLGVAGSALHARYLEKYADYKKAHPEFFQARDWPLRLAREVAGE